MFPYPTTYTLIGRKKRKGGGNDESGNTQFNGI